MVQPWIALSLLICAGQRARQGAPCAYWCPAAPPEHVGSRPSGPISGCTSRLTAEGWFRITATLGALGGLGSSAFIGLVRVRFQS